MSRFEEFVLKTLAIVLVPVVAGLALYVKLLWTESAEAKPSFNGYVAPIDMWGVVDYVQKSTVTIECKDSVGSGFSFRLSTKDEFNQWKFEAPKSEGSLLLTNFHVVEECSESDQKPIVRLAKGKQLLGEIKAVDAENDIAVLVIDNYLEPLLPIWWKIYSGFWVMATGSPFDMQGTVTFGNVINSDSNRIYTSASLNRGNSGGPLTDNEGYVIGINTGYRAVAQNLNWAIDVNALCDNLVDCNKPFFEDGLIHPRK